MLRVTRSRSSSTRRRARSPGRASTSRCGPQARSFARTRPTVGGRCWRSTLRRGRASGSRHSTATGSRRSGVLAAAEADGTRPVVELLARDGGPASRAVETVVVTASVSGPLATRLVQRSLAGQGVSVVWVDAPSFVGRPTRIEPELLRLQAAGVAVAVVRRGDSLAAALGAAAAARRRRMARTAARLLVPGVRSSPCSGCGSKIRRRPGLDGWWHPRARARAGAGADARGSGSR